MKKLPIKWQLFSCIRPIIRLDTVLAESNESLQAI